jgi:hypothetical protein
MYIEPIPRWIVLGALTAAIVTANLRGGLHARIVAAVLTGYVILDFAHIYDPLSGLPATATGFAICLAVTLKARRYWTVWAAASQLLTVATDILRPLAPLGDWAYYSAQLAWGFVLVAALVFGSLTDRETPPPKAPASP